MFDAVDPDNVNAQWPFAENSIVDLTSGSGNQTHFNVHHMIDILPAPTLPIVNNFSLKDFWKISIKSHLDVLDTYV